MSFEMSDAKRCVAKKKAGALRCLGDFLDYCAANPDSAVQEKHEAVKGCKNCDSYTFCRKMLRVALYD